MSRFETIFLGVAVASLSTPAFAGPANPAPAPIVGIGVGAAVLVGIGYRALKKNSPLVASTHLSVNGSLS
jgi:hypothetical protein